MLSYANIQCRFKDAQLSIKTLKIFFLFKNEKNSSISMTKLFKDILESPIFYASKTKKIHRIMQIIRKSTCLPIK